MLLVATGCTDEPEGADETIAEQSPSATPDPGPSPSPSPTFEPVQGTIDVATLVSDRPDRLGFADNRAPDMDVVRDEAAAVARALNRFLEGAQRGNPNLAELRGVWLDDVDPAAAEVLRTELTNPDIPVAGASYRVTVHVEPEPVLAGVLATVEREDGTTVSLELVFDITGEHPRLQLVGGGEAV